MRVVSKFKDYYDNAVGFDTDPNLVYVRKTETISVDRPRDKFGYGERKPNQYTPIIEPIYNLMTSAPRADSYSHRMLIGFCGKAYLVYRASTGMGEHPWESYLDPEEVLLAFEKMWVEKRATHWTMPRWRIDGCRTDKLNISVFNQKTYPFNQKGWNSWQKVTDFNLGDDIFRQLKTPVFSLSNVGGSFELTLNPCLRHLGFQRLVDPWQAYQELSMYLGSNMVEQVDPQANISDEDRQHMLGFRDKYSFKKEPTKR